MVSQAYFVRNPGLSVYCIEIWNFKQALVFQRSNFYQLAFYRAVNLVVENVRIEFISTEVSGTDL